MEQQASAPSLPSWALIAATIVTLAAIAFPFVRAKNKHAQFLFAALTLRYLLSAYHQVTYQPLIAGLSINAMASIAVFAAGLALIPPRRLVLKALAPVYLLIGAIVVSGAINPDLSLFADALVKWGYFLVILICAREAAKDMRVGALSAFLLFVFVPPAAFQALSVVLHVAKLTEADGAVSYIGGYNHEAAFSIVALTAMVLAGLAVSLPAWRRYAIMAACLVSLYLTNYRTAILAAAPLLLFAVIDAAQPFRKADRRIVVLGMGAIGLCGLCAAGWLLRERFSDFGAFLRAGGLPDSPSAFTAADRQLFSSRLYLWSQYLDAYGRGDLTHLVFGAGPEAWEGRFVTYAHNTLISTLYEYGVAGALALLFLWGRMIALAGAIADPDLRWKMIAAHSSVIVLNMSTMAQWLIEGLILYALVCGATMLMARKTAPAPAAPRSRAHPALAVRLVR
jgi:hypothetical protein